MKNACISLLSAAALILFFSFTNNKPVSTGDDYLSDENYSTDTIPQKKDTGHKKAGTTPYDSFGKPKKMDSIVLK